jgi:sirohydrochlorin cobaltochelatase
MKNIPIVVVAFGTTSRAMQTYDVMNTIFQQRFAGHEIHWAFSSRMVAHHLSRKQNGTRPRPHQVLETLAAAGHPWAVVQSLHLTCGHEFYRLVSEVDHPGIRTSIGLPMLSAPEDHAALLEALRPVLTVDPAEAVVLIGHGTDHPAWTTYTALAHRLQNRYGQRVQIGVVEQGYPDRDTVIRNVATAGYGKARLVPLLLVAGVHFAEDLAGEQDSWKSTFEAAGIHVALAQDGLGHTPAIVEIFCHHTEAALDVIPAKSLFENPV